MLVVGGTDGAGGWLGSAEYYDPATSTFSAVEVSDVLGGNGFAGASLTTLPDGRVAISGGPQPVITLFDPVTRTFGESVLIESRAFHASFAVGASEVLLAGGCQDVSAGACTGILRNSSKFYSTTKLGISRNGPVLRVARLGATPFELGELDDGQRWVVLAGGTVPASADPLGGDRLSPELTDAVAVTGLRAQAAALDGGALITAFAPDGATPKGIAATLAPGSDVARVTASAPELDGVRLVTVEDGWVVGFGGQTSGDVVTYDPTIDRWIPSSPGGDGPNPLLRPALLRLADGTVLVFDGAATPTTVVHLYRPSLVGPSAGSTTVVPGGNTPAVLTAPDPATVTRVPEYQLAATDDLARALVGGPRRVTGSVTATVRVKAGGLALVAQQTSPGRVLVAELPFGSKARLVRRAGGRADVLCTGTIVESPSPNTAVTARLEVAGMTARLLLDDAVVASCDVGTGERGAWGVAALGAGARVAVDTVTVAR